MGKRRDELIARALMEHYERYYRLAYGYVHNEADALDIVQEGAYKAIMGSNSLKNIAFIDTWLYRIMVNEALNLIKKKQKCFVCSPPPESGINDVYEDLDLKNAIEALGEPDRTIIRLRFFEEVKLEEIAIIIGENVSTTKSRLYRTLKKLRLSLEA